MPKIERSVDRWQNLRSKINVAEENNRKKFCAKFFSNFIVLSSYFWQPRYTGKTSNFNSLEYSFSLPNFFDVILKFVTSAIQKCLLLFSHRNIASFVENKLEAPLRYFVKEIDTVFPFTIPEIGNSTKLFVGFCERPMATKISRFRLHE